MAPLLTNVKGLIAYLMVWLMVGVLMAVTLVTTLAVAWPPALLFALPASVALGLMAASGYYVCRALPLSQRTVAQVVGVYGGSALLSGALWAGACFLWNQASELLALTPQAVVLLWLAGSAMYLVALLVHDVLFALDKLGQSQMREAESRLQARDAELLVLRSQINPHFLFNSLNSISALTSADPAGARNMTIELAEFFRQTLALGQREQISLADEVELCRHFLAIESIRYGDRLRYELDVSPTAAQSQLAPMLLQPCVENAVKHGIGQLPGGGLVSLKAITRDGWLHISVSNPVPAKAPPAPGTGTGLSNTRRRLRTLYGERASVHWQRGDGQFTLELTLPLQAGGAHD